MSIPTPHRRKNMFDEWDEQLDVIGPIRALFDRLNFFGYNHFSENARHQGDGHGESESVLLGMDDRDGDHPPFGAGSGSGTETGAGAGQHASTRRSETDYLSSRREDRGNVI